MSEQLPDSARPRAGLPPAATLNVELVGDVICPFTYLGKRRLDSALRYVHGPACLGWYPFQLNPDMPKTGQPFDEYVSSRFGSVAAIQPVFDRLQAEGRDVGIEYRFDKLTHVPNTLPAHQVLHLAAELELDPMPILESLMSAYLTEGLDIGRLDVLTELARPHGLSAERVVEAIEDERTENAVKSMEAHLRETGVDGVPGFLMNRRLLLVGVQEVGGIVEGFDRAMFGDEDGQGVSAPLH